MEVSRIRALRGPNLWSRHTAIEAVVTCSENERSLADLQGLEPRLRALFPAIGALQPQGKPGPVSLAHVLEGAALSLQAQAGCPVTFSHTATTPELGVYQVVVEYTEEAVGRKAFTFARELIAAALAQTPFDVKAALAELRELDEDENGPASILRDGLAYDRCQVGVVTDFGGAEDLAEFDIQETDQLYKVLRTQVDVVLPEGVAVLNAADEGVASTAPLCDGDVIFYAADPTVAALAAHRAEGRRAVYLKNGWITLASGGGELAVAEVASLRFRHGQPAADHTASLLASIAAAWAMGISPDLITAGIETFELEPAALRTAAAATAAPAAAH